MGSRPLVIKLGGAALSNSKTLAHFFNGITKYRAAVCRPLVIVHGGGYLVDDVLERLGFKSEKKNGIRVTPKSHLPFVVGALAGTANKHLQASAMKSGIEAIGLSLSDGGLCKIEVLDPLWGHTGKASPNDGHFIQSVLEMNYLPIISSVGIDAKGDLMNVNADQGAVAVAAALDAELVILSDVSGVLDGKGVLIPALDEKSALKLIESGVISDGMVVKVKTAFEAVKALERSIEIASWRYPEKLLSLFSGDNVGTRFTI